MLKALLSGVISNERRPQPPSSAHLLAGPKWRLPAVQTGINLAHKSVDWGVVGMYGRAQNGGRGSKTIVSMCVRFSLPGELSITAIQLFLLCPHWTEHNQEVLEPI